MSTCNAILLLFLACAPATQAQKPVLAGEQQVHDSVMIAIHREFAEGLWAEDMASGALKGYAVLEMVIDDKGRSESVRVVESDLPIAWKNVVKDQWFDRRYAFKLAKYHKEKVTIHLQFPRTMPSNE
ncbi:MAG: hypothetical protein IPL52_09675 [Flavobacteriales bacterium]|nr:hypothetical protein [Flavobacteriales bacterium]